MADTMEKERQLMDMMACDLQTAQRALQQSSGDLDRAIDALLSGSIPIGQSSSHSNSAGWDAVPPPPPSISPPGRQDSIRPLLQDDEGVPARAPSPSWGDKAGDRGRQSERNTRKRNSPIDLTADDDDDDDDLKKAMQASMKSFRSGNYGGDGFGTGHASPARGAGVNADDEALTRAIEASMLQSHYSTREQSPQLSASQLDAMGANRLRPPDQPVTILAPLPFMHLFASALQALHASAPLRHAIQAARFVDIRARQGSEYIMDNYWRGASPTGISRPAPTAWQECEIGEERRECVDTFMRLSTLFTFMAFTKRPLVLADDVITHSPLRSNYAYVMNSERKPSHDIFSCYVQGVLDSLTNLTSFLDEESKGSFDVQAFRTSFQSFTVNAVEPQEEEPEQPREPLGEAYEIVVSTLLRSNVNNSVHRALYALLAEDRALFSKLGKTLFFCIGQGNRFDPNLGTLPAQGVETGADAAFTLEPRIFLDAFTFRKRNGVRLGLETEAVRQGQARVDELERYRKSIITYQGDDTRTLLRSSLEYFRVLCRDDGKDDLRSSSVGEAGPQLEAILAHLEQEIAGVDDALDKQRRAVEEAQKATFSAFEGLLAQKDCQTMPYDLQAALFEDDQSSYAYVRHGDDGRASESASWWLLRGGDCHESSVEEIVRDRNTLTFLVYTAVENADVGKGGPDIGEDTVMAADGEGKRTVDAAADLEWWRRQALVEAIEHDNATFGAHLAELVSQTKEEAEAIKAATL